MAQQAANGSQTRLMAFILGSLRDKVDHPEGRKEMLSAGVVPDLLGAVKEISCEERKTEVLDLVCKLAYYTDSQSAFTPNTVQADVIAGFPLWVQLLQSDCEKVKEVADAGAIPPLVQLLMISKSRSVQT
eukprot:jgi/Chlat1/4596/Chrsp290S04356